MNIEYGRRDYFPPEKMRFTGWWFLLAQVPVFVLILLAVILTQTGSIRIPATFAQPISFGISVVGYGITLGVVVLASRLRGIGSLKSDYGWEFRWVDILWGFAGLAATYAITIIIAVALHPLGHPTSNIRTGGSQFWNATNLFVGAVLIAAPIEELAFRGLFMRWIRNAILRAGGETPTPRRQSAAIHWSVVLSALCFALFHLYEATDLVSAFNLGLQILALGLINGYLATFTGRLGPGILTHAFHNALAGILTIAG